MRDQKYIRIARSYIGMKETTGRNDSPILKKWLKRLDAMWLYFKPWCGTYVAICLKDAGYKYPKLYFRAKAWLNYGQSIDKPVHGCIVVFNRKGGGHVGFVVGKDYAGRLLVLGGNQRNSVNITPFNTDRVLGYRLPAGYWLPQYKLETMASNGASSTNEA